MPRLDRSTLLALLASGVLWIGGAVVGLRIAWYVGGLAAVYVALGSIALASRRQATGRTLIALWVVAVALLAVLTIPSPLWASALFGGFYGSVLFVAWSGTGFVLLHAVSGRSATDSRYEVV